MAGDIWISEAMLATAEADNVTPFEPQITNYVYADAAPTWFADDDCCWLVSNKHKLNSINGIAGAIIKLLVQKARHAGGTAALNELQ